ncbi:hypothetical protein CC78DRAFT_593768 [Lojkania enalia]|uniref:Uncharacterized protein n=1 Tax=Lojkania enalia TaxID=147567 RepID=A0A9P4KIQ7_9PLEO|nr:hypothetical protein CC78DRAFT_593768 [Didymosphaeria enalia]
MEETRTYNSQDRQIYSEGAQFFSSNPLVAPNRKQRQKFYTPVELRTPFLLAFCIMILVVFTLLQVAAAAYHGVPSLHSFVARAAQDECPLGATCTPKVGSRTNLDAAASTTFPPLTAPPPGSWTDPNERNYTDSSLTSGWSRKYYFVGAYLPTLTAIMFSVCWRCIFVRLKEMQPLYQLNKPGGALSESSMMLSYTTAPLGSVFLSSLKAKHWLICLASVNVALTTICTAFAPETLFIDTSGTECRIIVNPIKSTNNDCHMHLAMRPALAWVLGVILFIIFAITVALILRLRHSVSGIFAEATSIVGIACLYNIYLSRGLIRSIHSPPNLTQHPSKLAESTMSASSNPYSNISALPLTNQKRRPNYSLHPAFLAVFWLYLIGLLIFILYYRFISKPGTGNVLEDFMNSQSLGVRPADDQHRHCHQILLGLRRKGNAALLAIRRPCLPERYHSEQECAGAHAESSYYYAVFQKYMGECSAGRRHLDGCTKRGADYYFEHYSFLSCDGVGGV